MTLGELKSFIKLTLWKNRLVLRKDKFEPSEKKKVNLNYWVDEKDTIHNIGDMLSKVIVKEVANLYGIDIDKTINKTKHLYAIGSILLWFNDATIWGSGFIEDKACAKQFRLQGWSLGHKLTHKTDVRAVRGPETKRIFDRWGIDCSEVFGDPAILLPKFYTPKTKVAEKYIVMPNWVELANYQDKYPTLSPITDNWRETVDKLCSSELAICSSLHGIILAEAYGIPAVLLETETTVNHRFKYNDYYYSTGRYEYPVVSSVEDAFKIKPALPNSKLISEMREKLIEVFPKDLWD